MAEKKGKKAKKRLVFWLYSTGKKEDGSPTGCKYVFHRNPKNVTEKLEFKKYDWVLRKHIEFKEKKIVYQAK
jgi:large subunit ribosomal protein L33